MLTWELIGALVGAGFASGREIAAFFTRYGAWGYAGVVLAVLALVYLADSDVPATWQHRWPGRLWKSLLALLLAVTGGAMLSGAGEIAALVLPLHGAYWLGMVATLLIAWLLAHRTTAGLAWVSRIMLCVFVAMICAGLLLPGSRAVQIERTSIPMALVRGACYGGFNAALLIPVMRKSGALPPNARRQALTRAGAILLLLLALGNAVLLRHPALLYEPMPFVRLLDGWGKWGYYLSAACLYLAILSTLTACLRGLGKRLLAVVAVVLVALNGFDAVVEHAYSALGAACCLMLLAAKFTNCSRKAFISGRDML